MGLERVKDQEKRREQENHNVGRGTTYDRKGLIVHFPMGGKFTEYFLKRVMH
jgi:hypothetical protein